MCIVKLRLLGGVWFHAGIVLSASSRCSLGLDAFGSFGLSLMRDRATLFLLLLLGHFHTEKFQDDMVWANALGCGSYIFVLFCSYLCSRLFLNCGFLAGKPAPEGVACAQHESWQDDQHKCAHHSDYCF